MEEEKNVGAPEMGTSGLESNLIQISCQRDVKGDNFGRGVQDYNFSIGGRFAWRPSKSFFRVGIKLTTPLYGISEPPSVHDNVAFADGVVNTLFDNCYVRAGGADVSSIINYSPQAAMVKARTMRSGAWLDNVGGSAYGYEADFQKRVNSVSDDGVSGELNQSTYRIGALASSSVSINSLTGVCTGTDTRWDTVGAMEKVEVHDTLVVEGQSYKVKQVVSDTSLLLEMPLLVFYPGTASPLPSLTATAFTGDQESAYFILNGTPSNISGGNIVYVMWQPPCGIFDHEGALGSGSYRIQLNPNSSFETSAVQLLTSETKYEFSVEDVQYFCAVEKNNIPATGVERLFLTEIQCQTKTLTNASGQNVLDFTVPPSTKKIAVFIQSAEAGTNPKVPPTMFKTIEKTDQNLQNIQLTYANKTSPSTNWTSEYNKTTGDEKINFLQERWHSSQCASGMIESEGGAESLEDWIKRGGLYVFDYERDSSDRSTHAQLSIKFGDLGVTTANVFLASCYTRTIAITTTDGYVSDVKSLSV